MSVYLRCMMILFSSHMSVYPTVWTHVWERPKGMAIMLPHPLLGFLSENTLRLEDIFSQTKQRLALSSEDSFGYSESSLSM